MFYLLLHCVQCNVLSLQGWASAVNLHDSGRWHGWFGPHDSLCGVPLYRRHSQPCLPHLAWQSGRENILCYCELCVCLFIVYFNLAVIYLFIVSRMWVQLYIFSCIHMCFIQLAFAIMDTPCLHHLHLQSIPAFHTFIQEANFLNSM